MPKTHRCEVEVRGYELDSFEHVNHGAYVNYLEHARWKMLFAEDITIEKFKVWQRWPVIARIEVQYLKPSYMGDLLEIQTFVSDHARANLTFDQKIFRKGELIVKAVVRSVIVNEKGRPADIPRPVAKLWAESGGDD